MTSPILSLDLDIFKTTSKDDPEPFKPTYATDGSIGLDIYALVPGEVHPGQRVVARTGWGIKLPKGYGLFVLPKSGLSLKGVVVANSPGLIDCDYQGEVGVALTVLPGPARNGPLDALSTFSSPSYFFWDRGTKIAQFVILPVPNVTLNWSDPPADKTSRGTGGFGSTGSSFK